LRRQNTRFSVFKLSDILFAWEILYLAEVIPLPKFTKVPGASKKVLGVFSIRGKIIPLIDIRPILRITHSAPCSTDMAMLIRDNKFTTGILINEVVTIIDIANQIDDLQKDDTIPIQREFVRGKYTDSQLGNIYILNHDQLMHVARRPLREI
jgi:chemotaxis signal transduction protein